MGSNDDIYQIIQRAVQNAKYNEVVTIDVNNHKSNDENKEALILNSLDANEIILVASLDESNGGIVWKRPHNSSSSDSNTELQESKYGTDDKFEDEGIKRHLRTKKWILPMLHDSKRNHLYHSAIQKACHQIYSSTQTKSNEATSIQVLDIGTGTGLLAMMTAKCLKTYMDNCKDATTSLKIKITSLEMASAMARLANKIVHANNLEQLIQILPYHSCDQKFYLSPPTQESNSSATNKSLQPTQKAVLCTSELLESGLLGEGIIPTLRDAWKRHLEPNAIMIPQRARIIAQIIESKDHVACYRGPVSNIFEKDGSTRLSACAPSSDRNDSFLLLHENGHNLSRRSEAGGVLVPIRAEALLNQPDITILTDAVVALEFDFTRPESIPPPEGRSKLLSLIPSSSGTAHGVLFWWELDLWDGLTYSTKPVTQKKKDINDNDKKSNEKQNDHHGNWQDHWQQCLFVWNLTDENCPRLEKGISFTLIASHTDYAISFSFVSHEQARTIPNIIKKQKVMHINPKNQVTYHRALQLSNINRIQAFNNAIQAAIKQKGNHNTPILDLSDFSLCGILAATGKYNRTKDDCKDGFEDVNATHVNSIESGECALSPWAMLSSKVAQIGNELPIQGGIFQIWNTRPEMLTKNLLFPPSSFSANSNLKVEIVMAEPYYEKLEGWHLQEAINFYYILRGLRQMDESSNFISPDAIIIPQCARIMGCAVELNYDMAKAYGPLLDENENIKYEYFGEMDKERTKKKAIKICGFDHTLINHYVFLHIDSFDMKFNMFQYEYKMLTEPFELGNIDYRQTVSLNSCGIGDSNLHRTVVFKTNGICHGMMMWVEYDLGPYSGPKIISTNTRFDQQSFRMLKHPEKVTRDKHSFCYSASFGGKDNNDVESHYFNLFIKKSHV